MALTLYTNPQSRGRIARWMLEETGQRYDAVVIPFGPEMHESGYERLNPMGKVPTLVHDGKVVTECAAICAYLADAFPEAELAPPPSERAAYYRWLFFAAGPLEAAVTNRALGWEAPERRGLLGYGDYASAMDALEHAVTAADPFLVGERFTAADVYLGSQIGWGLQFGSIERRPAFEAYWARLADRPAKKRANDLDEAAIAPASASG